MKRFTRTINHQLEATMRKHLRTCLGVAVFICFFSLTKTALAQQAWTVAMSPTSSPVSTTQTYTFTATNTSGAGNPMGCIEMTFPAGFTLVAGTASISAVSGGKSWTASISGTTVIAQANSPPNRINMGQVVVFTVNATAPATAGSPLSMICDSHANSNCTGGSYPPPTNSCPTITVLTVTTAPTFSKSFAPDPIASGGTSTLTFTIGNTANTVAAATLAFTDNLPTGVVVATPSVTTNSCGGTLTATEASSSITLSGGSVAEGASCTIAVDVTSTTAGTHTNTSGDLTSTLGNSGTATDDLTVTTAPTFSKSFAPDPIVSGGTSTLSFTIDNTANTVAAATLAFTDNLPAGVVVETPNGTTNSCGGTLTATEASSSITLSGGTVAAGTSCTIQVDVTFSSTPGQFLNVTSDLTSSLGNSGPATATLTVEPPPTFSKSFSPNPITVGGTTTLTFTIDNSASELDADNLAFTDNLPAGVVVAASPNASKTCTGGTITAIAGSGTIMYSGGTVAAFASCTIQVDVTSSTADAYLNTTGDLTSSSGNSGTASRTLTVTIPPGFSKSFSPNSIGLDGTSTLTFTVDNTASFLEATSLAFTDNLPAGVVVATPANESMDCTGGTLTATAGTGVITYSGGTVGAGASCTIQVDVTSSTAGAHDNTTGDLTTSSGNSGPATATLTVTAPTSLPHEFLFLAEEFVESKKHKLIEGNIHSNNDIEIKKGKKSDIVGNLFAVDDIEIGKKNDIDGDVTAAGDVDNDGDVSGTITEDAGVASIPLPVIGPFAVGTGPVEVDKKETLPLPPGSYGNVEVEKKGTLQLSSGEYNIKSLELSKSAKLCIEITGGLPVVINISDDLVFGKSSEVIIKPNGEADSDLVTFNFADDDDNKGKDDFVEIGKKATVLGTIIAPDAWVVLQSKSRFKGAICAENIVVKSKVVALHHSSTSGLPKMLAEDDDEDEEALTQAIPTEFELSQNYPNPFNPSTNISFALPQAGEVSLKIYNLRGQLVATLHDGAIAAGRHQMVWDGKDARGLQVASGIYLYRLQTEGFAATQKLTLMK